MSEIDQDSPVYGKHPAIPVKPLICCEKHFWDALIASACFLAAAGIVLAMILHSCECRAKSDTTTLIAIPEAGGAYWL